MFDTFDSLLLWCAGIATFVDTFMWSASCATKIAEIIFLLSEILS